MIGSCSSSTDSIHFLDMQSCLRNSRELAACGESAYASVRVHNVSEFTFCFFLPDLNWLCEMAPSIRRTMALSSVTCEPTLTCRTHKTVCEYSGDLSEVCVCIWDCTYTTLKIYFIYRVINKSVQDFRPLRCSSRDGRAEGERVNRGRGTPSFCPTLQVLDISTLLCLSRLLRDRVRKFWRNLQIALYLGNMEIYCLF